MSRQSSWSPISLLAAGLVVIVILLAGPDTRTAAVPSLDEHYPPPELTKTAVAAQAAAAAYPGEKTDTPTVTGTLATATPTAGGTRTPTFAAGFPTETPSPDEPLAAQETATPELTATPPGEVVCAPGVPVEISGEGPPRAPFLLYFGRRAVSGGSIDPNGRFTIALVVGRERAGVYIVTVQVRGTSQVLRQFTCAVPATTPTPLPRPLP